MFACFYNVFLQNTVIYTFVAIKPFQNIYNFIQCFQLPYLPKPLKTPLFTLFSSIFPCSNAAGQLKHIYKKPSKTLFFTVFLHSFYNVFRQKHRNLHVFRHTVGPKHSLLQCFQCSGIQKLFKSLISPNPWKHRYLHCFLQFFHVPMPLANSNIYTKSLQKHCFFYSAFT